MLQMTGIRLTCAESSRLRAHVAHFDLGRSDGKVDRDGIVTI